ncbi:MAG: cache domain-containing protein [Alphaproteobacteria bacterium]|nr:cache domain-containing protein [Alphaproteobacteria bacterium]
MSSNVIPASRRFRPSYGLASIRGYLLLLIAAILVPMLILAGMLAWHYANASRRTIEAERLDVVNNLTYLIDREIGGMAGFLNGIAISPNLRLGDPATLQRIGEVARAHGFQSLGLFDQNGHLLFVKPPDGSIPFASAERAGVAAVLAGKPFYASNLQIIGNNRPGLFYISVPVTVDGKITHVLTGGVPPAQLQGLFAEAGLREEWRAGITDRTGVIMARSRESATYVGHLAQKPMVEAALGGQSIGLFDVVSRDGVEVKNAFKKSDTTGWTVGVAVPSAVVNASLWSAAFILIAVGCVLTLISLGLAILVARRITNDVNNIGHAVVAYASGDVVPLPTATLTELRDVLRVVEAAAAVDGDRAVRRPGERA